VSRTSQIIHDRGARAIRKRAPRFTRAQGLFPYAMLKTK